jgi:uncharacterized protein YkwD
MRQALAAGLLVAVAACGAANRQAAVPTASPQVRPGTIEATVAPAATPRASLSLVPAEPSGGPRAVVTGRLRSPVPVPLASPRVVGGVLVGSTQQQLTNRARAAAGLRPLAWSPCLAQVAAGHAMEMAVAGAIFHGQGVQQDLACALGSRQTGENVGETSGGVDDQRIFDAFMASPGHRANILGPYRYAGTAWVIGTDGTGYVSVEFG